MNWRDRWWSFLRMTDRSLTGWLHRLPPLGQMLLLPPAALFVMIDWARSFPRATAAAAMTLVAAYVPLIWSGVVSFSWGGAWSYLGAWCLRLLVMLYAPLLGMLLVWPLF